MLYYRIKTQLEKTEQAPQTGQRVELYTSAEWDAAAQAADFSPVPALDEQRFSRVDPYPGFIAGVLTVPEKGGRRTYRSAFYVTAERLIFIEDDGFIERRLAALARTRRWKTPCAGIALASLLNDVIDDDMEYLEAIEDALGEIEEGVLDRRLDSFNRTMIDIRKELLLRTRFYSQLRGLAMELEEDENGLFNDALERQYNLLADRAARLEGYCQALREYSVQIREVYQASVDLMQNNTMKLLTVVATIFMPLTLIAGWYGMNFVHMPELKWAYGYPAVIALSLAVAAVLIWWFKKKKML